jgi:hypothetical protein
MAWGYVLYSMDGIMTWERRQARATDQAPSHALVVPFVDAWLQRTLDCLTVEAHQQALHGFRDKLAPWVLPTDLPTLRAQPFTLFDHLAFTPPTVRTTRRSRPRLAAPAGRGPPTR